MGLFHRLLPLLCLPAALWCANPDAWIPARWQGGPLEVARRAQLKTAPAAGPARDAVENWYEPATLRLLEGSPVNCLLVTWSAGPDRDLIRRQQEAVKPYAAQARAHGIAVLGLVYPGPNAGEAASAAAAAGLDGLALDGDFPADFAARATKALSAAGGAAVVIPIFHDAAAARAAAASVLAVEGVSPRARNLADMGIRAAPSSEPWIESNIWLVRSFRLRPSPWHPVWIDYEPEDATPADYPRFAADAAVAGGRWIVNPDDKFRAALRARDAAAMAAWQHTADVLRFAEEHAEWRGFAPFGHLALIVDPAAAQADMSEEYLKLVTRRQTPYRPLARPGLTAASLAGFRAVLATELAPPTAAERQILCAFAEDGGVVIAGPSWGGAPKGEDQPYAEVPMGKGRVVVYREPDPESVARDLRDLLSQPERGVTAFNVPGVITYSSSADSGRRVLVQLLNYSSSPAEAITIRVSGHFTSARLFTPGAAPARLEIEGAEGRTEVAIPKVGLWGALLLE